MKKKLQLIIILFVATFFVANQSMAQVLLQRSVDAVEAPSAKDAEGEWIHWDNLESDNSIGTDAEATFSVASRWFPEDLEDYDGMHITAIRFVPAYADATYTVKIWVGDDLAPSEFYSQSAGEIEVGEWNVVELFDPIPINAADGVWFGYLIETQGGFPAGCDAGPEVAGKGNMILFGGPEWVELTELNAALTYNWSIGAYVIPADDDPDPDPDPDDTYSVTFNVDMTGVEGFDPEVHHVFMTGSPTGWAEPGSEGSVQLQLVPPAAKNPPYTFYENFEGYEDFTTDLSPWITLQLTEGNTWGAGDFDFPGEGTEFAWMAFNPSATEPPIDETDPPVDGSKVGMAIQYTDIDDDKWLISPEFSINETSVLSFHARSHTHAYGAERIRVLVSTTGSDPGNFIAVSDEPYIEVPVEWTEYVFPLGDYDGETLRFAINYVSNDAFIFFIDAITLSAEADDPDPGDVLIYTATLDEVEAGTIEYKYFSDAFGAGWDGGEWPGDPNREAEIEADTILDDVWGVYDDDDDDTSVPVVLIEEINVYPNPASSNLTVTSNSMMLDVTVYDITGRAVMNASVNDNTHVFDVSSLRNGLYIMQVKTVDGIEGLRFHVVK